MALLGNQFDQIEQLSQGNSASNPELSQSPEAPPELPNPPYRCGVEQDKDGRIVRRLENMSDDRIVTGYAYDGASRLARVKVNGRVTEEYRYDDKGRRSYARLPETSSGQAGRCPRGLSFKYRDGDRLGGVGLGMRLEYDNQGRTVQYHTGGPELAYDAVDIEYADLPGPRGMQASIDLPTRLTYTETRLEALRQKKARFATDPRYQVKQAKSGQAESKRMETKVVAYTYDEDAMRRSKISETAAGRSATHYAWLDPFRLAAIRVPWSKTPVHFHYADNARLPYAATCQGTVLYLLYDHIGSLRVAASRNGHIVREIEYESFGHVVRDTNPGLHLGYGFAGGLHDPDTGFVRFWVRDYDPKLGRFLSPDPAWQGEKPGRKAESRARATAEAGQQVVDPDRYGYCLDDPVNMTDPTGMGILGSILDSVKGVFQDMGEGVSSMFTTGSEAAEGAAEAAGEAVEGSAEAAGSAVGDSVKHFQPISDVVTDHVGDWVDSEMELDPGLTDNATHFFREWTDPSSLPEPQDLAEKLDQFPKRVVGSTFQAFKKTGSEIVNNPDFHAAGKLGADIAGKTGQGIAATTAVASSAPAVARTLYVNAPAVGALAEGAVESLTEGPPATTGGKYGSIATRLLTGFDSLARKIGWDGEVEDD